MAKKTTNNHASIVHPASRQELADLAKLHIHVRASRNKINQPLSHASAFLFLVGFSWLGVTIEQIVIALKLVMSNYTWLWMQLGVDLENTENENWASHVVGVGSTVFEIAVFLFIARAYFNLFFNVANKLFPNGFMQSLFNRAENTSAMPEDISNVKTKAEAKTLVELLIDKKKLLQSNQESVYFWLKIFYTLRVASKVPYMVQIKPMAGGGTTIGLTGAIVSIVRDPIFGGAIPSLIGTNLIARWHNRGARKANIQQYIQLSQLSFGEVGAWKIVNVDSPRDTYFELEVPKKVEIRVGGAILAVSPKNYTKELMFALQDTPWRVRQIDKKTITVKGNHVLKNPWASFWWSDPVARIKERFWQQLQARHNIRENVQAKQDQLAGLLDMVIYTKHDREDGLPVVKFIIPVNEDSKASVLAQLKILYGDDNVQEVESTYIAVSGVGLAKKQDLDKGRAALAATTPKSGGASESSASPASSADPDDGGVLGVKKRRCRGSLVPAPAQKIAQLRAVNTSFTITWPGGYIYDGSKGKGQDVFPITVPWAPANTYYGVIKPGVGNNPFDTNHKQNQLDCWDFLCEKAREGRWVYNDPYGSKSGAVGTVFEKTIHGGNKYDVVVKNNFNMGLFGRIAEHKGRAVGRSDLDNRAVLVEYSYVGFRH